MKICKRGHQWSTGIRCAVCVKEQGAERYKAKREELVLKSRIYYQENKETVALANSQRFQRKQASAKEAKRLWEEQNPEKVLADKQEKERIKAQTAAVSKAATKAYKQKWAIENKERLKEAAHQRYLANKQEHAAKAKIWREKNKDTLPLEKRAYYEANRSKVLAACKAWRENNPEKPREIKAKYRAAKLKQTPIWYCKEDMRALYKALLPGYHIDHIIPLQGELVSGLHWAHNLQMLPASENCSKGNKFDSDTYVHELPLY